LDIENLRLNSQKLVDSYVNQTDWRTKENANQTYSLSGLLFHLAQTVMAHYALRHIYPKQIAELHINGDIHLHDLGLSNTNYCVGHNLRTLLTEGLYGTHANSNPARHFSSALLQIINYLGMSQHEHAGAQAFSSIDTYLSPFIAYDNLDEKQIKQKLQEFLFNLNIPSRWGQQLLFSNLTLDWIPAPDLKNEYVIYDGKLQTDKYIDFLDQQKLFNKLLIELFLEGDKLGKPFSFPIPTINLTKDFPWDDEETDLLMQLTAKYGTPYFQNFVTSDLNPNDVRAMCVTGDSLVHVKKDGKKERVRIDTLINEYETFKYKILTSQGYREIKEKFKYDVDELIRIRTESGNVLSMSLDHLALVYKKGELRVILASDLEVGMRVLIKRDIKERNNLNYGNKWAKKQKEEMSEKKKHFFIDNPEHSNEWFSYLNRQEKVIKVENIKQKCSVYDIEIKQKEGEYKAHDFYVNDILTHNCCRLRLDLSQLRHKTGGLFGSGENTGSIGVVDINLNRIGYLSKNEDEYIERLDLLLNSAKKALEIKRKIINKSLEMNLLPLTKKYIGNFNTFFSTIGIVGMNESMLNFMNKIMNDKEAINFSIKVMKHIRKRLVEFQEETENLYNLEATPAESSAFRLAKKDKELYPNIRIYNLERNGEVPMLTNSTQLPVDLDIDIISAIRLQEDLQNLYNSGTVLHLYVGEFSPAPSDVLKNTFQKIIQHSKIPYFTWTPTFSICPNHNVIHGNFPKCPKCGSESDVYSRIVGYYRPVNQFNAGKQQEFKERKVFKY